MIENEAGMTWDCSRIFLQDISVLKQPRKLQIWTSKLIFECSKSNNWRNHPAVGLVPDYLMFQKRDMPQLCKVCNSSHLVIS